MKILFLILPSLFLLSSCTPHPQYKERVKVNGKAFDLAPGLYLETENNGKRLLDFKEKADCIISASCTNGMSVRSRGEKWKSRLSINEFKQAIKAIPNKNLAFVSLSQYDKKESLSKLNNQVSNIAQEFPFGEIIITKRNHKGTLLLKYINNTEQPDGLYKN